MAEYTWIMKTTSPQGVDVVLMLWNIQIQQRLLAK